MSSKSFSLPHLGILAITGVDATTFLQGQLSCDAHQLNDHTAQLGAHCNPQGRIVSSFWAIKQHQQYYLIMPVNMIEPAQQALQRYAVFSKVNLQAADLHCIGGFSEQPNVIALPNSHRWIMLTNNIHDYPEDDYRWRLANIEAGIPTIYPSTQNMFLPHRVNFQLINGLDFNKGCYVGQEVIARMHYRGQLKHHMYRVQLETPTALTPGLKVYAPDNKLLGEIVDAVPTTNNQQQALIVLPKTACNQPVVYIAEHKAILNFLSLPYQ